MHVRILPGVLAAVLIVLFSASASGQEARGSIQGRVTDTSGGGVPGATVEVLKLATGVITPTTRTRTAATASRLAVKISF
jgi:hypothetical protein